MTETATHVPVAVIDILTAMRVAGGVVRVEGDRVHVRIPGGIPAVLKTQIIDHKPELVAHLSGLAQFREERAMLTRRLDRGMEQVWAMERKGQIGTEAYETRYALLDRLRVRLEYVCDRIAALDRVMEGIA